MLLWRKLHSGRHELLSDLLRRGQGPQKSVCGRADISPVPTLINA